MSTNPLTDVLPTNVRKWIYVGYSALGITFGATQVGFATANADQPLWLLVAFGVFGYLGTALGLVAASNTQPARRSYAAEIRRQTAEVRRALEQSNALAREIGRSVGKELDRQAGNAQRPE